MADKAPITLARVRELLHYDPETGRLTWAAKTNARANRIKIGDDAGYVHNKGRRARLRIEIDGGAYYVSVLIWFYMTGEWPTLLVDHRDGDKFNNKWMNLRLATNGENIANTPCRSSSKTGFKGVSFKKGRYMAAIKKGADRRYLGYFSTPEEAHAAYVRAAREMHGEFARAS